MGRSRTMRIWLILVAMALVGCGEDICDVPLASARIGDGSAGLDFRVVEEDGLGTTRARRMECVDVLVLNPASYADTLAHGRFSAREGEIVLTGLRAGPADVIVDVPGYFPTKFVDVTLNSGINSLPDKVLMFKSDVDVALPGHVGLTLRESARLADVKNLYSPFGRVNVQAAPGGHYELKIPFRGVRGTRRDVEALLGRLVRSPHIETARPLVSLSAAVRSG